MGLIGPHHLAICWAMYISPQSWEFDWRVRRACCGTDWPISRVVVGFYDVAGRWMGQWRSKGNELIISNGGLKGLMVRM